LTEKTELEISLSQIQQKLQDHFQSSERLDVGKLVEKAVEELKTEKQYKEKLETQLEEFQQKLQSFFPAEQLLNISELVERTAKRIEELEEKVASVSKVVYDKNSKNSELDGNDNEEELNQDFKEQEKSNDSKNMNMQQ